MSGFTLCAACERHVRGDEASCPMCLAPLLSKPPRREIVGPVLTGAALLISSVAGGMTLGTDEAASRRAGEAAFSGEAEHTPAVQAAMAVSAYGMPSDDRALRGVWRMSEASRARR